VEVKHYLLQLAEAQNPTLSGIQPNPMSEIHSVHATDVPKKVNKACQNSEGSTERREFIFFTSDAPIEGCSYDNHDKRE
jgi:hypothetical protein